MHRPRVFPGGPHTGTPITAAAINKLDAHLDTIIDWQTDTTQLIGGTKTFANTCTCEDVVDSVITCQAGMVSPGGYGFSQTGALINDARTGAWKRRTAVASQTLVFPATDCVVSLLGPVANSSVISFDGRRVGWKFTFDGSLVNSLGAERYLCLPQTTPLDSTINAVRIYYTGQITTACPVGSRPIQAQFNKAAQGRPKFGGDLRALSEPMNSLGDALVSMPSTGTMIGSDRIIIGLKLLVSATWSCLVHRVEVDLSNVTRHAFDRGWS